MTPKVCPRCLSANCYDPDDKACSDNVITRLHAELKTQTVEVTRLTEELADREDVNLVFCPKHCDRATVETANTNPKCQPCLEAERDALAAQLAEVREKLAKVEALCIAWGIDYDDPATRLNEWADRQQATTDSLLTENTSLREQLAEAQQEIERLKRG